MNDTSFLSQLAGEEEVTVTVVGRRSGNKISTPVWFTVDGNKLELLPMYGEKTNWFRNFRKSGNLEVAVKKVRMSVKPRLIRNTDYIERVKDRFSTKYGAEEVKKYYPECNVALEIDV
jgi:deazaflavin-dependent oxidoreductase (nitroreductase family)